MSISTLQKENNLELYLTTSDEGIKISNIPNNLTTNLQSASLNQYTLLLPSKALNVDDILAVDSVIDDKVFLKWSQTSGGPTLPTDVINCNILNATQEVNTSELTLNSENVLNRINTTIIQPDSNNNPFDVKIFLPKDEVKMLQSDSLLYVSSSLLIPGTPNTIEMSLDYTKSLPEFNIDIFSTKSFTLKNATNQKTTITAATTQDTSIIDLVLPINEPQIGQILFCSGGNQLAWGNPGNLIEKFQVESRIVNPNITLTSENTFYSRTYAWAPVNASSELVYCADVEYLIRKVNTTGSFAVAVRLILLGTTTISGFTIKDYGPNYSDTNPRYDTLKFYFKAPSIPNQNISFDVTTDISAGGQLLLTSFSYNIYPVGFAN